MNDLLIGRWEFVGAENYSQGGWSASSDYVKGMQWTFLPIYFSPSKIVGRIIESSGNDADPTTLNFAYQCGEEQLSVEVSSECVVGDEDKSEIDLYRVELRGGGDSGSLTINVEALNQHDSPPPFFRYILQRCD